MTRQFSKGICNFCHGEFSRPGMTRHLETCPHRMLATQAQTEGSQESPLTRGFHLIVEERRPGPTYWMHLEMPADITLATLDHFLRDTWLECCGHLSAFEIGGVRYVVDAGLYDWDTRNKNMRVSLREVLRPGQTFDHDYDFGSTTELSLKVVAERAIAPSGQPINIIARNNPPYILCDICGKRATELCNRCMYDDMGCLCDECAKDHKCGEEMLLPIVNSPRMGVCGYTGQDHAYIPM